MPRVHVLVVPVALLSLVACVLPPTWSDVRGTKSTTEFKAEREAVEGVNAFAADLYAHLRAENGNLIVSPYSISAALALAAVGAEGTTRAEMEKVLHLPPGAKVGPAYGAMTNGLNEDRWLGAGKLTRPVSELRVANSLWLQKGASWKKEYLAVARDDFGAMLSGADFVGDPEGACGRVNKWVANQTNDKIKNLVPRDAITGDTRLVLANAIYFKARWAESFEKKDTKPEDFTLTGGSKVRAPLMYQKADFGGWEDDTLQTLKLSYDGKATSMYVLLPRKTDGLPALEQQLTAENLAKWTAGTGGAVETRVWLPRFKFTVPTELAGTLQTMGMREAFDRGKANFKGMTDDPRGLFISRVIHKAFVETDEVGTEAAAATAVTMALGAAGPPPMPRTIREFRADHPFLFVIKHEPTGAILFMGRVLDPTR